MLTPCPKCHTRATNAYGKHQCRVLHVLTVEARENAVKMCSGNVRANAKTVFGLDSGTVLRAVSGLNCSEDTYNKLTRAYKRSLKEIPNDRPATDTATGTAAE